MNIVRKKRQPTLIVPTSKIDTWIRRFRISIQTYLIQVMDQGTDSANFYEFWVFKIATPSGEI